MAAPGASQATTPRGAPRTAAPVAIVDWAALTHVIGRPLDIDCPDTRGPPRRAVKPCSKMLPLMMEAPPCTSRQRSARSLALRTPRDATLFAQAAADSLVQSTTQGGTPRGEGENRDIPGQLATGAEGEAVARTLGETSLAMSNASLNGPGGPSPHGLLGPRPSAPNPADADRRQRLRAATTLLNPHVWAAASALRPSSAARPTTPAWRAAVAEAAQMFRPEFPFPVVDCGDIVRGTRGALAGQRYRRYRCSVCAAHNDAVGRPPDIVRRPIWIEVPIYSGEGELSSRPGIFLARRAEHFAAHAHGSAAHASFTGARCHCSDVGAGLRAVEAAAERLETVVVQPSYGPTLTPTHSPLQALGHYSMKNLIGHPSASQWDALWGEAVGTDTAVTPRHKDKLNRAAQKQKGPGLSPRNQGRPPVTLSLRGDKPRDESETSALDEARQLLNKPASARRAISSSAPPRVLSPRGDRETRSHGSCPPPKDVASSPRAHLSYMGATGAESDSESSETYRPPTPPSCTAPIAASRRRALAYEVALCY
jgi:hypothetical protein